MLISVSIQVDRYTHVYKCTYTHTRTYMSVCVCVYVYLCMSRSYIQYYCSLSYNAFKVIYMFYIYHFLFLKMKYFNHGEMQRELDNKHSCTQHPTLSNPGTAIFESDFFLKTILQKSQSPFIICLQFYSLLCFYRSNYH